MNPIGNGFPSGPPGFADQPRSGNPRSYPGVNHLTQDPSRVRGDLADSVIGSNANWTSDLVNADVDIKIVAAPTRWNKKWLNMYPAGCILFGRPLTDDARDIRESVTGAQARIFRPIDSMELLTPEMMNYVLHKEFVEGKYNGRTITSIFLEWRVVGLNVTAEPVTPGHPDGFWARRVGTERVLDIRPRSTGKMIDYWGERVSGEGKHRMFFALKWVPVIDDITIHQPCTGEIHSISNLQPNGERLKLIPQWVALCSDNHNTPSARDIFYEVESNNVKFIKCAPYVDIGTCTYNSSSVNRHDLDPVNEVSKMRDFVLSKQFTRIDVLVNISYSGIL
jgi:hypothetical protein